MKLKDIYASKPTVLSLEIFPPKKDDELKNIEPTLDILCQLKPDFISITFGAGGSSNNNKTIALAKKIKSEYHVEPVVHLTGMCYSKAEIDSFVKNIQDEGIENILALRGDHNPNVPKKDDFEHASDLISYLKEKTDFSIAAACYPEDHPDSPDHVSEILNLRKKADAGTDAFLSQLFFDNRQFYAFEEDCRIGGITAPIIPGIMPVVNAAQIQRMITTCGARLTPSFARIIERYGANKEAMFDAGMAHALSQIVDLLASGVRGIHLYSMNNPQVARRIFEGVKNLL